MSMNILRHSLVKFLKDNLSYNVTFDSNDSELKDITGITSADNLFYVGTPFKEIHLLNYGLDFKSDDTLIGKTLQIDLDGSTASDEITDWDEATSIVTLKNGIEDDILTNSKISILSDVLIYVNSPHSVIDRISRIDCTKHNTRFDLYVKVRKDVELLKLYNIIGEIRNLILSNYLKFNLIDKNDVVLGTASVNESSYTEDEVLGITEDVTIHRISFIASYTESYRK